MSTTNKTSTSFICGSGLKNMVQYWGMSVQDSPKKEIGTEVVSHPQHYNTGKIEVITFIYDQNLNFSLGNAVKYVCRAAHKGKPIEDLRKAIEYIQFEINDIQQKEQV